MRLRIALPFAFLLQLCLASASPQDSVPLSTGKLITPQGRQTEVGSLPANMLLTPDGRFVIVTNTGFRQYLCVLSAEDGRIVSRIQVGKAGDKKRLGLYYGL